MTPARLDLAMATRRASSQLKPNGPAYLRGSTCQSILIRGESKEVDGDRPSPDLCGSVVETTVGPVGRSDLIDSTDFGRSGQQKPVYPNDLSRPCCWAADSRAILPEASGFRSPRG